MKRFEVKKRGGNWQNSQFLYDGSTFFKISLYLYLDIMEFSSIIYL